MKIRRALANLYNDNKTIWVYLLIAVAAITLTVLVMAVVSRQ
jgi:hypothetical protein